MKTAVIGAGRWGRNIARDLAAASDLAAYATGSGRPNVWMAEHTPARLASVEEIAGNRAIAAVAIATPIATHAALARAMLEAGKHVLVEKPLAASADEEQALAGLAAERGLTLVTGYQFLCHPAYEELKRRLDKRALRQVTFTWRKWGTFEEPIEQSLLTHHLALALDLLGEPQRGTLRRLGKVESACDAIETHLAYPNAEVESLIDRGAPTTVHTLSFDLDDSSAYVWNGNRLLFVEEPELDPKLIFESNEMPLAIEIARFLAAASGETVALPAAGDFGARVVALQDKLKIVR